MYSIYGIWRCDSYRNTLSLIMLKISFSLVLFLSTLYLSSARSEVKTLSWFTNTNCTELTITKYKSESNHDVVASVSTKEKSAIKEIIERIKALPVDGDKMKSWGPKTKYTALYFTCEGNTSQSIEIYDGKFKTPSTGYIVETLPAEQTLAQDIEALVLPILNVRLPKIKDYPVRFKDFLIKFTGNEHTPQPEGGPTVGPTNRNYFSVWENSSANEVSIAIFDGQIPPQPQAFVVGKKIYYLLTYQGVKGEALSPNHFMVSDKLPRQR